MPGTKQIKSALRYLAKKGHISLQTGNALGAQMRIILAALGLASALLPTAALAEPSEAELAEINAMLDAAQEIDPRTDEPAYFAAYSDAYDYAAQFYAQDHPALAMITYELAIADMNVGRFAEGAERIRQIVPILETAGPEYRSNYLSVMNLLLVAHVRMGELTEAREIGEQVLVARRELVAEEPDNQDYIAGLAASLNNSGFILNMDGNHRAAIENMIEVEALVDTVTDPSPELLSYLGNGPTYWAAAGDSDMALNEGRRLTAKLETLLPPNHPILANSYNSLSVRAAERGQLDEAERFSRRAIDLAMNAENPDMAMASSMRLGLAQTLIKKGSPAEALASVEEALVHITEGYGEKGSLTLYAQHVRAHALRDLSRLEEAIEVAEYADQLRAETMEPANMRRISGQESLAEFYLEAGRPLDAYNTQLAAQEARETGDTLALWEKIAGDIRMGAYGIRAGRDEIASVAEAYDQLIARRDAIAASGEVDSLQLDIVEEAYVWALDAAIHSGEYDLAFRFVQNAIATKADRATQMAAFRQGLSQTDAVAVREYQDRAEALRALSESQIERMSMGVSPEEMSAMNEEIALARAALVSAEESLEGHSNSTPEPIELTAAQSSLEEGEALLLAHPMPQGLGVIVATQDDVAMHIAPLKQTEVTSLATDMRSALTSGDALMRGILVPQNRPSQPEFDFAPGAELHDALFSGEAGELLRNSDHLRVAAGGALSRIPFAALAPQATSLADADWLIRRHAISTVASLSTLGQDRSLDANSGSERIVGVGAPDLQGESLLALRSSRGLPEDATVADLPPLPEAAAELDAIANALDTSQSVLLVGQDAREMRVLDELTQPADVIAFATHGLLECEIAGLSEPALVLTPGDDDDGLLMASEVAALEMDADWVILSACNTGGPNRPGAAGLSGLASAFLYAGARNLLVSHWEVADDVAESLTVPTVESYYKRGLHPAEGLQQAIINLLDESDDPRLQHPAYWGPFVYVGG